MIQEIPTYNNDSFSGGLPEDACEMGSIVADDPELVATVNVLVEKKQKKEGNAKAIAGKRRESDIGGGWRCTDVAQNGKTVGSYNCQIASDDKYKLIVLADVVPNAAMIPSSWSR